MGRVGVTVQTGTPRRLKRLVMECKDCEALDSNPDHASQASSVCIVGPVTTPQIPVGIKQAYDTNPVLALRARAYLLTTNWIAGQITIPIVQVSKPRDQRG